MDDQKSFKVTHWINLWINFSSVFIILMPLKTTLDQKTTKMMSESSPLTSHVLNTADGVPAARLPLSLHRLDPRIMIWTLLSVGTTNEDGRCAGLISREAFGPGMYKLRFETGSYWESLGQSSFYPYVEVRFSIYSSGAGESIN
ncbi:5-hydroxyisourate hydrolase-like [Gymnodraco acuticeps]|uniref:Transthyretin n=1 Tax=Gymnodraco acuticeps TaxID=8218 RepID=A0A6P8W9T5_GYMAC|nr:5-hydroxyisourate hydrolase-like [Gymnodraco acuticeps]